MRKKVVSIIEYVFLVIGILILLGWDGYWTYKHYSFYKKKYEESLRKKREFEQQVAQKTQQIKQLEVERRQLKIKLEKKKAEEEAKSKEYKNRMKELEKFLSYLPPEIVWPELVEKVEKIAKQKYGLYIAEFSDQRQLNDAALKALSKKYQVHKFTLVIKGEYSKLIKYLWFLENMIVLHSPDGKKTWKAILKMDGASLQILSLDPDSDTMKIKLQVIAFFRKVS